MEMVLAGPGAAAGASGIGSLMLTAAYYVVTTQTLAQIPAVVEVMVVGVEEIVHEAVEGSKGVVRCFAMGSMVIVAIAIVQLGIWIFYTLNALLRRCRPRVLDPHEVMALAEEAINPCEWSGLEKLWEHRCVDQHPKEWLRRMRDRLI